MLCIFLTARQYLAEKYFENTKMSKNNAFAQTLNLLKVKKKKNENVSVILFLNNCT